MGTLPVLKPQAVKHLAKFYVAMKPGEIRAALDCGELREVNCDE